MDTVETFRKLQDYYGEELVIFHDNMTKHQNKIWEELLKNNSTNDALKLYDSNVNNIGSKAWFKANPNSYQTVDMQGFEYLRQAFIAEIIDIQQTNKFLHEFSEFIN